MAKKGTFGALKTQAPQVDFGQVARTVAGDVEAKRQTLLKEKLLAAQQEDKQKKYAQQLRQQSYRDTVAFAKEAKEMMNIDTSGMLNPVLTEVLKTSQNKYADMMREFANADTGRRAELNIEMQRYNSIANNINSMSEGINSFFKDYNSIVNGKPKYSAFGSSQTVLSTIKAIKGAATQGLKQNEDGTYNWGDKIKIHNMGTPDMEIEMLNEDGSKTRNSMESITSTLTAGLKPYNDISGAVSSIASKVKPTVRGTVDLDNTTATYRQSVDVGATMGSINAYVNNYVGSDTSDIMQELINNGQYGDTPKEIKKNMSKTIFDMQAKDHNEKVSKNPNLQQDLKKQANQAASTKISNVLRGDVTAVNSLNNKIWNDSVVVKDKKGNDKEVSGAKVTGVERVGNYLVVKLNKDGQQGQNIYPLNRMSGRKSVGLNIAQALQGVTGATPFDTDVASAGVNYGNIPVIEGEAGVNIATALDNVVNELAPFKKLPKAPSDEDMNAAVKSIKEQGAKLGIDLDIDMNDFWNDNEIKVTRKDGTVLEIDTESHSEAIDQLMNALSTEFNQPIGEQQTTDIVTGEFSSGGAY